MDNPQLITLQLPLDGLLWLRDCAEFNLEDLEPTDDEEVRQFEAAAVAIQMIDEQLKQRGERHASG